MSYQIAPPLWNSLEIVKLIVSGITPIVVIFIGFIVNKALKKYEKLQLINQKILEKRIQVYEIVVPKLNDILCFHCYIGNWKDLTPETIIQYKRDLDKQMNIYAPLFSKEIMNKYNEFIQECFETFTGWGNDAKIKSLLLEEKNLIKNGIKIGKPYFQ